MGKISERIDVQERAKLSTNYDVWGAKIGMNHYRSMRSVG